MPPGSPFRAPRGHQPTKGNRLMFRSIWSKARESEIVDTIAGLVGIVMLLVGVVLGAVALGAAPAHAAPAPTDGGKGTVEVFWAMPNGGTPEEVTWPQLNRSKQP